MADRYDEHDDGLDIITNGLAVIGLATIAKQAKKIAGALTEKIKPTIEGILPTEAMRHLKLLRDGEHDSRDSYEHTHHEQPRHMEPQHSERRHGEGDMRYAMDGTARMDGAYAANPHGATPHGATPHATNPHTPSQARTS